MWGGNLVKDSNEIKDKINILLNPDNFYGKFTGGLGRLLLFSVVVAIPFLLYTLLLVRFFAIKYFLFVYIPFFIDMLLRIVGREDERIKSYIKQKNDEYANAKELIKIPIIHEDGMVEYQNGFICYIIQAYSFSYFDDNSYSKDLEVFLDKLFAEYNVDIYGHLVVGELNNDQNNLEKLSVYKDESFLKERLNFYKYQDKFTNDNSKLYRLNFVVESYKNNWGKLKDYVINVVNSENVSCFDCVKVCNKEEANDVVSRDITLYVDIGEMLRAKYDNDNYFGSKILYFGELDNDTSEDSINDKEERRIVID